MEEAEELFDYFFDMLMQRHENESQDEKKRMIMYEIKECVSEFFKKWFRSSRSESYCNQDKIEICRSNLSKMIDILYGDVQSRGTFLIGFNNWKNHRTKSIDRLDKIAKAMYEERKVLNALRIIYGVVGAGAGACILASIFFPPAGVAVLPAWLGGSASFLAPYLPSFFRRTVVPATSVLAINGGIASAISGATELSTAIAEVALLKKNIEEAKGVIETDKEHFKFIEKWFAHAQSFEEVMKRVLDMNAFKIVSKDIIEFAAKFKSLQSKLANVRLFFQKLRTKIDFDQVLPPELTFVVIAVLFMIFLLHRQNQLLFVSLTATTNIFLSGKALNAGIQSFTALSTEGAMAGMKRVPKVLIRDATLGVFAGLGLALNTSTILLSTIDLSKGSLCEHGKKIEEASLSLKEELEILEEVYKELEHSIIEDFFWASQNNRRTTIGY